MIVATLEALAAALALLNSTRELVRSTRAGPDALSASIVVQRLPGETFQMAERLRDDLRQLRADLQSAGVDLDRSAEELEADFDWWRLRRNRAVRNIRPRLQGVGDTLATLLNDLVAVAQCFRAEELIVQSYRDARNQQANIRTMTDPSRPVGRIIDEAEALVSDIAAQLGDMR